jgi:hypothetical protein
MSEQGLIPVSCKLEAEAVAAVDQKAGVAGISRSECLRALILSGLEKAGGGDTTGGEEQPLSQNLVALLQQILYVAQRTHIGMYRMPRQLGFLELEQVEAITADTLQMSVEYMADLDAAMAETRELIAAARAAQTEAKAAAE